MLHLENALKASPQRPGLHIAMAEVLLHGGNLQRAEQEIAAELSIAPHSLRARVRRGEVELLKDDILAALADWTQALEVDPARCEAILGVREFGFGDTSQEKLTDHWREQLTSSRGHVYSQPGPASRLALEFISTQEDPARAVTSATEGGDSGSTKSESACTVPEIRAWLAEDRLREVAACSTPILKQPPAADLRMEIARALCETGRWERALAALAGLAPPQVDSPEAQYWKVRCYNRLALAAYLQLFAVDPDSDRAHQVLGDMAQARDQDSKAIEEYQQALARRPTLPNLYYQIGHLEWKSYHTKEAREQFQAELGMNPRHTGALFDMGSTYLQEHHADKALVYLQRVCDLDSKYPDVHDFMGIAFSQLHRYVEAVRELKIAVPGDKDGSVHYQLARVYTATGKPAEAKQEIALSDQIRVATHRANEGRVQRIAAAEAALKQP
jgi:tetratricopeptide (TPR) repeat protein